ncbi:MAG: hypothetical protein ACR2KY_03820 [Thermoleophilaceae bacterium]
MGVLDDAIREHLALQRRHGVTEAELKRQETEALGPARREPSPRAAAEESASPPAAPPDADIASKGREPDAGALAGDRPPADDRLADEVAADEVFQEFGEEPLGVPGEEATRISGRATLDDERILDEDELAEEELADELAGREGGLEDAEGLTAPQLADASGTESPTEEHATAFSPPPAAGTNEFASSGDELEKVELAEDEAPLEEEPLAEDRTLDDAAALEDEEELLEEETELAEADEPLPEGEEPAEAADADEDEDVLEDTPEFLQETPEHERLWFEQKPPRDFDLDR